MICYYVLFQDNSLEGYNKAPEANDFIKQIWQVDLSDRKNAWMLIIHATKMGASPKRLLELMKKWEINEEQAPHFELATGIKVKFKNKLIYLAGS